MNKPTVLVVYHYFARYRLPVLRALAENEEMDFKFVSGVTSEINIEKISPKLARISVSAGGLEWRFVDNVWVKSGVILWQKGLISKCAFGRFDAVIFLGSPYFLTTWLAAIFCRVRRKRVLFWTHGVLREGGWKDTFRKLFFKISNGLLLYSDWAKGNLSQNGFESDKLFVIKNSLDYEAHRELRAMLTDEKFINKKCELFSEPDLPLLMFIGRLTPQKKLLTDLQITEAIVPGLEGELDILPGHAPLVTTLSSGILKYKTDKSSSFNAVAICWGYCEVTPTGVVILAETAEVPEELELDRATAAKELAEQKLKEGLTVGETLKYQRKYQKAQTRLELLKTYSKN